MMLQVTGVRLLRRHCGTQLEHPDGSGVHIIGFGATDSRKLPEPWGHTLED